MVGRAKEAVMPKTNEPTEDQVRQALRCAEEAKKPLYAAVARALLRRMEVTGEPDLSVEIAQWLRMRANNFLAAAGSDVDEYERGRAEGIIAVAADVWRGAWRRPGSSPPRPAADDAAVMALVEAAEQAVNVIEGGDVEPDGTCCEGDVHAADCIVVRLRAALAAIKKGDG